MQKLRMLQGMLMRMISWIREGVAEGRVDGRWKVDLKHSVESQIQFYRYPCDTCILNPQKSAK
jgi:hypothetical protein